MEKSVCSLCDGSVIGVSDGRRTYLYRGDLTAPVLEDAKERAWERFGGNHLQRLTLISERAFSPVERGFFRKRHSRDLVRLMEYEYSEFVSRARPEMMRFYISQIQPAPPVGGALIRTLVRFWLEGSQDWDFEMGYNDDSILRLVKKAHPISRLFSTASKPGDTAGMYLASEIADIRISESDLILISNKEQDIYIPR